MIYNYPYFGFPNYMKYMSNTPYTVNKHNSYYQQKRPSNTNIPSNVTYKEKKVTHTSDSKPFFSIFGINLYFDDILLICLIFFLYNEKVDDTYLLLSLVLLLLS